MFLTSFSLLTLRTKIQAIGLPSLCWLSHLLCRLELFLHSENFTPSLARPILIILKAK